MVQGSKLSGLPDTIYTNEVPLLQEIMKNREICEAVGANYYEECNVEHVVVNLVDDNNNLISAKPGEDLDK